MVFEFEDLEYDAIYELFKFLDVKELVRFERLNKTIREINSSLERCKKAALDFQKREEPSSIPFHCCGVPSHRHIKSSTVYNVDQILEICKKFPKMSSIFFGRLVEGSVEMGKEIGLACPKIEHVYLKSHESEAMVEGILRETDVTHLSTMFGWSAPQDYILRLCPNLTYLQASYFDSESRVADLCFKLRALTAHGINPEILSKLAPQLTSINSVSSSSLHAIAHQMSQLETLCYEDDGRPFEAPVVQNFPNLTSLEICGQQPNQSDEVLSYFVTGNHQLQSIKTTLWLGSHILALINENCPQLEKLEITGYGDFSDLPLQNVEGIKHPKRLQITTWRYLGMKTIIDRIFTWKISVDYLIVNDLRTPSSTFPEKQALDMKNKIEMLAIGNKRTKIKIILRDTSLLEVFKKPKLPNLKAVLRREEY